jgi:hypothetical protein
MVQVGTAPTACLWQQRRGYSESCPEAAQAGYDHRPARAGRRYADFIELMSGQKPPHGYLPLNSRFKWDLMGLKGN